MKTAITTPAHDLGKRAVGSNEEWSDWCKCNHRLARKYDFSFKQQTLASQLCLIQHDLKAKGEVT